MPKKEFQTQHYYLKWICVFPLFQLILYKNKELKPKKILKAEADNWYEK